MATLERWNRKQDELQALLEKHGATEHAFRVDLAANRAWWVDTATDRISLVATTKVLCSWAHSSGSMLAGWINKSLPPEACVPRVASIEANGVTHDEAAVLKWALSIAEASGAELIHRALSAQAWIFLGLWNVRPSE